MASSIPFKVFKNYRDLVSFLNVLEGTPNECVTQNDLTQIMNGFILISAALRKQPDDAGKVGLMLCHYYATLRERIESYPDKLSSYNRLLPMCFINLLKWFEYIHFVEQSHPGAYNTILELVWLLMTADQKMVRNLLKSRQRDTLVKLWTAAALAGDYKIQQKTYQIMQIMFKFSDFTSDINRFIEMEKFDFLTPDDFANNERTFLNKFNKGLFPYSNVYSLSALHLSVGSQCHYYPPCGEQYIWLVFNFSANNVTATVTSGNRKDSIDMKFTIKHMVYDRESCLIVFEILPPIEYTTLKETNLANLETTLVHVQLTYNNYEFLKQNIECFRSRILEDVGNQTTKRYIKRKSIKRGLFKIVPSSTASDGFSVSNVTDTSSENSVENITVSEQEQNELPAVGMDTTPEDMVENIIIHEQAQNELPVVGMDTTPEDMVENIIIHEQAQNELSAVGMEGEDNAIDYKANDVNENQESEIPFVPIYSKESLADQDEDDIPLALLRSKNNTINVSLANDELPLALRRTKRNRVSKIFYTMADVSNSPKRKKLSRKSSGRPKKTKPSTPPNEETINQAGTPLASPLDYNVVLEQKQETTMSSFEYFCNGNVNKVSTPKGQSNQIPPQSEFFTREEGHFSTDDQSIYRDIEIPREIADDCSGSLSLLNISFNSNTDFEGSLPTVNNNDNDAEFYQIPNNINFNDGAQEEAANSEAVNDSNTSLPECNCLQCNRKHNICRRMKYVGARLHVLSKDIAQIKNGKKYVYDILEIILNRQEFEGKIVDVLKKEYISDLMSRILRLD